jgi:azurin
MTKVQLAGALALMLMDRMACATTCNLTIEANDMMQYNLHELAVSADCPDIEVTLRHSGKLQAKVMGHDWVLARTSDVSGIINGGMAAGLAHDFLPANDRRIIAATKVIGGGETATIRFNSSALEEGASYTFFCTAPGHASVMRGRFVFGATKRVAQAGK